LTVIAAPDATPRLGAWQQGQLGKPLPWQAQSACSAASTEQSKSPAEVCSSRTAAFRIRTVLAACVRSDIARQQMQQRLGCMPCCRTFGGPWSQIMASHTSTRHTLLHTRTGDTWMQVAATCCWPRAAMETAAGAGTRTMCTKRRSNLDHSTRTAAQHAASITHTCMTAHPTSGEPTNIIHLQQHAGRLRERPCAETRDRSQRCD
jgi:hypothetical protein